MLAIVVHAWAVTALVVIARASPTTDVQTIAPSSSLIHYHGRWDSIPSTWWYVSLTFLLRSPAFLASASLSFILVL
jgi:hypothetical protein